MKRDVKPSNVRAVRIGHGGNCSSVGSVVDTLFLGATAGGAILAALCAAMRDEQEHPIVIVGSNEATSEAEPERPPPSGEDE